MTDTITVDPTTFSEARRQALEEAIAVCQKIQSEYAECDAIQGQPNTVQDSEFAAGDCIDAIRNLLDEPASDAVLVPVEPTPEMIEAGSDTIRDGYPISQVADGKAVDCYRAMIEARAKT